MVFFYYERGKVDMHDVEGRTSRTSPMMGTPHLWAHAYKLWVGGVSPRCGIEWINAGGIGLLGPFPKRTIPFKGDVRPSTNYLMGTPHLWAHAYKLRVGGVSPRCGIEQIRMGGISLFSPFPKWTIPSKEEVCPSTHGNPSYLYD